MFIINFFSVTLKAIGLIASLCLSNIRSIIYLRTRGGGRVSWDEVREWHGHIHTTKCEIDS